MDEEVKQRVARFRFGVIHDLVGERRLKRGERKRLLGEKSSSEWEIPGSGRSYISSSTILSWVARYRKSGGWIESLYPEARRDKGRPRVLDEETVLALVELKEQLRGASLPLVYREAKLRKILPPESRVHLTTIYRLFRDRGLMKREEVLEDRRRFEAELPNDIWQSDAMHGPRVFVEGKEKKTYLFAFIDDMSRLVCHGGFFLNEKVETYAAALRTALKKRGLPRKLYVDNGPAFRSHQLGYATASLGIALIHSKPYQPQGRGKIERFFRTVRMQFLAAWTDGRSLEDLNQAFSTWVDEEYHSRVHSSTRQTPLNRYLKHAHLVREAPKDLDDHFRCHAVRKVDRDRTVSLNGRLYEAPVALIGKSITVLYHPEDPARVEAVFMGTSQGLLVPLDMKINGRIRRDSQAVKILPVPEQEKGATGKETELPEVKYAGGRLFGQREADHEL